MKRTVVLMLALCALGVSASFGQNKKSQPKKVAVYVTAGDSIGEFVGAYLVDAITHNSGYTAVERTAEFLNALNREHEYQRTGMVDDEQIAKLGKQFGAKLVCVVKIGKLGNKQFVQARLLEAETATVRNSAKPFSFTLDNLEEVCVSIATQLLSENKESRTIQSVLGN